MNWCAICAPRGSCAPLTSPRSSAGMAVTSLSLLGEVCGPIRTFEVLIGTSATAPSSVVVANRDRTLRIDGPRFGSPGSLIGSSCLVTVLAPWFTWSRELVTLSWTRPWVIIEATSTPKAPTSRPDITSVIVTRRTWSERRQDRRTAAQTVLARSATASRAGRVQSSTLTVAGWRGRARSRSRSQERMGSYPVPAL
jgi:hypothetical protein